ncbi:MAG: hypothetical protein ACREH8_00530 [Opitutaceae bacterium]
MSLWEYKVITSGKGGFATPALLEKFLNDLGRDEWEIIHFQTPPDNFLAFTGLVRRSTQRDWTLEDAAAAAAKVEAEKLRAEFEAKFKAAAGNAPAGGAEERAPSFLEEKVAPNDGFRNPVDTSHDDDPDADEEEKADEWDKITAAEEDELPTFFEAIKPHMRRNQRGPGMSVGVDYLAKKWDQTEDDLKAALAECGFVVPADEDAKTEYLEYDGDLYWLNVNRRGELWINTKEKPRPVFRPVKAARIEVEAPVAKGAASKDVRRDEVEAKSDVANERPETGNGKSESPELAEAAEKPQLSAIRKPKSEMPPVALPEGAALLNKIRPHMRRNRRGPGGSGSASFLSRALRTNESELRSAFAALGLTVPATSSDKPVYFEIENEVWWLNLDSRGGLWINGREKKEGESLTETSAEAMVEAPLESVSGAAAPDAVPAPEVAPAVASADDFGTAVPVDASSPETGTTETTSVESRFGPEAVVAAESSDASPSPDLRPPESASVESISVNPALTAVRMLLKETRTGAIAAKVDRLADELGKPPEEFVATLVDAGLRVPEKPREKPVFVEYAGEVLWLNKSAKGELWLNAKAPKVSEPEADESSEPSEGGEGEREKKPGRRAARPRIKKPDEAKS